MEFDDLEITQELSLEEDLDYEVTKDIDLLDKLENTKELDNCSLEEKYYGE